MFHSHHSVGFGLFFQVVLVVPNINFEVQAIISSTKFPASSLHRSVTVWLVFECFAFRRIIRAVGIVYRGNSFKPGEKEKLMHKQRGMCKCVQPNTQEPIFMANICDGNIMQRKLCLGNSYAMFVRLNSCFRIGSGLFSGHLSNLHGE